MLILASQSPRRKELLEQAGLNFQIILPEKEESHDLDKTDPKKYVETLSYYKAEDVFKKHQEKTVIGADTVVVLDKEILEKPIDEADAFKMLKKLSGKKHQVMTGVTIFNPEYVESFVSVTDVYFKTITEFQIREYIATKEPMDKAGSYAIQGIGSQFVEKHVGDLFTVIGLPLKEVLEILNKKR